MRPLYLLLALGLSAVVMATAADPAAEKPAGTDPALAPVEDVVGLPRVLIIGDSVSIGYTAPTRELLKGKANVHRAPENCAGTRNGLKKLDAWMGEKKWDVIHFNFGLHDAKQLPEGPWHSSLEEYQRNLTELVKRMKAAGAKVIFATTTPIPNGGQLSPTRRFDSIDDYNAAAKKVMAAEGAAIDDLSTVIAPEVDKVRLPNDVHYKKEGYAILAKAVAASVEAAIK